MQHGLSILDELIAVSGYHPKYAIHLLNAAVTGVPARHPRVRPTIYDDAAKQALTVTLIAALDSSLGDQKIMAAAPQTNIAVAQPDSRHTASAEYIRLGGACGAIAHLSDDPHAFRE